MTAAPSTGGFLMWKQILLVIGPVILAMIPATRPIASIVPGAIAAAEDMLQATGADKKAAALKLVDAGILATNTAAGKQVIDPTLGQSVASVAIDALVTTTNVWSKTPIAS